MAGKCFFKKETFLFLFDTFADMRKKSEISLILHLLRLFSINLSTSNCDSNLSCCWVEPPDNFCLYVGDCVSCDSNLRCCWVESPGNFCLYVGDCVCCVCRLPVTVVLSFEGSHFLTPFSLLTPLPSFCNSPENVRHESLFREVSEGLQRDKECL